MQQVHRGAKGIYYEHAPSGNKFVSIDCTFGYLLMRQRTYAYSEETVSTFHALVTPTISSAKGWGMVGWDNAVTQSHVHV